MLSQRKPRRKSGFRVIRDGRAARPRRNWPLPQLFEELSPSYQVFLSGSARATILDEIGSVTRETEVGGWLLSDPNGRTDYLAVATRMGVDGAQSRSELHIGESELERAQRLFPHLSRRGDWHYHPTGDPVPSETDLRAWGHGCRLAGGYWAAVIATPPANQWATEPELQGWITCGTAQTMFCEPLKLV